MSFDTWWDELLPVGRSADSSGYFRLVYTDAELTCREWFRATAESLGLDVEVDGSGNLWAWWHNELAGPAVVIGSHLDSVRDGGAFDGPLGVVSSFAAVEALQRKAFQPTRPVAIIAFADEEGARFGIACAGSRLLTGELPPERALALRDDYGVTMAQAVTKAGLDPRTFGRDDDQLARIGAYVELHVEQGRGLIDMAAPVAVGSGIWPHGRYRFKFVGEANHAGTTLMSDRHDPMLGVARTALSVNELARRLNARGTLGRVLVTPNSTNGIPSEATGWVDVRASDVVTLDHVVDELRIRAALDATELGVSLDFQEESVSPPVVFDEPLATRVLDALLETRDTVPLLGTGAGHDAGILANAGIPTAMLFVRNPTGISHSPREFAETADTHAGVAALTEVLEALAG
jgi:N-carbamoyl-L-amino-acid hydrolase